MYSGPMIDVDVHHEWPDQSALLPYLSQGWRDYVEGPGRVGPIRMYPNFSYQNPHGFDRTDTFPPNGGPPGSDYETLRKQLLDPSRIERAILTYGTGLFVAALPNPYFAAEVARASNDWTVEHWLSRDKRLHGSVLVANQLPDVAAEEIRRVGKHPQMAQVLLCSNGLGQPFGHAVYDPIYKAAVEMGLPVAIHAGGDGAGGITPSPAGSGYPNLYIEYHTLAVQGMMTHLVSLIAQGTFEKFRDLKVLLMEGGVAWVPALLWRFDTNFKGLRREVPWVKRLPSEYFYDHVRVSTQPLEIAPEREQLIEALKAMGGEDTLLFATDYPHWDSDEVSYISNRLPASWWPKVFYENAMKFYGWERGTH